MKLFLEKFLRQERLEMWKPEEVARRISVQIIKNLPEYERGTFQEGYGENQISRATLEKFYVGKVGIEGKRIIIENDKGIRRAQESNINVTGRLTTKEVICYEIPYNQYADVSQEKYEENMLIKLRCHISDDQVKRYYRGENSVPIPVLTAFCNLLNITVDLFMSWVSKDDQQSWESETRESLQNKTAQSNTINYFSYDELMTMESDPESKIKDIWIVLEDLSEEIRRYGIFLKKFENNLKRGVNYTYFVKDNKLEKALRKYCPTYDNNIKLIYLSDDKDNENYFYIPEGGYSIYEPERTKEEGRIGHKSSQYDGMNQMQSFRMHDEEIGNIVLRLKDIKQNQEAICIRGTIDLEGRDIV